MKFATKLTVLLVMIIVFSGIAISFFVYSSNLKTLEKEITDRLGDQAFHIMDKIDRNLYERYSDIQIMASDPIISSRNSSPKQITERLIEYRNTYKTYASLSFFDLNRIRIADTTGMHLGKQYASVQYWEDVLQGKISAASDIREAEELRIQIIYFASPVKDKNGEIFGVVVARMPANKLYEITNAGIHEENKDLEIDLVDKQGLLLYSNYNKKGILNDNLADWGAVKKSIGGEKEGSLINIDDDAEDIFAFVHEQGYLDFKGNDWTLLIHIPTKVAFAPAVELRNKLIIISIVIVAIVFLISFIFSRSISKPIRELQQATEQIEKGNFNAKVDIKTGDELEELGDSFNKTTEILKSRDLEHKQLDSAKTEFLSITSHELRSPMTPMRAQLQMLLGEYFGKLNKKQKESADIVLRNTERLDRIIQDFLEISRIEAARLKFKFIKTNFKEPINRLIQEMNGFMPEKNIEVIAKIGKLPTIEADPDRAMQVLRNLINNAKKFSPKNSKIFVNVGLKNNMIEFNVKDQGIGISPENQKRIFEPFFQAEQTMYREHGGTGLGLAICKGIIESQNGKMWIESQKEKGTTFHFTVPLKPIKEIKPIKLLFSDQEDVDKKIKELFIEYLGPLGEKEFETLKNKGLSYESSKYHINDLKKKAIFDNVKADEINKKLISIFGIKKTT